MDTRIDSFLKIHRKIGQFFKTQTAGKFPAPLLNPDHN